VSSCQKRTAPARRTERVLVVDDEADIRELIDLTLVRMGLAAECAGSVAEAKAALAKGVPAVPDRHAFAGWGWVGDRPFHRRASRPDPGGGHHRLRQCTENAVAALKAGAFDYLAKPVGLEQLRALIKSALRVPDGGRGSDEARCRR
jgi:two-component system response regulator PilR (NtrC family)